MPHRLSRDVRGCRWRFGGFPAFRCLWVLHRTYRAVSKYAALVVVEIHGELASPRELPVAKTLDVARSQQLGKVAAALI
jgi:hypothetical protein